MMYNYTGKDRVTRVLGNYAVDFSYPQWIALGRNEEEREQSALALLMAGPRNKSNEP